MKNLLLFGVVLLFSTAIYAQRNDEAKYWNTWEYTAKADMQADFEKAAAEKTAMFNKTPETAIATYRVITGPDSGNYLRVEGNKTPSDYDLDRSAEGKYWHDNGAKYLAKNGEHVRWRRLSNGSYDPDPENSTPTKFVRRTFYNVKADKIMHFRRAMYRMSKVAEKRGWEGRSLYRLISGGNRHMFLAVNGFDTYKRATAEELETTAEEDYNELFGWGSWDEDWKNFDKALEYWGEQSDLLQYVPEMSTPMTN